MTASTETLPSRRDVKRALRDLGLSDRQVKKLLSVGWAGLIGERDAELEELKEALADMRSRLVK